MTSAALAAILALVPRPVQEPVTVTIKAGAPVYRPGEAMPLRITIENTSGKAGKLDEPEDYLEGLEVRDPEGKVVKATGRTRGITKRSLATEPGGFFGRTVNISSAFDVPEESEGWHRLRWSFGDAASNEIRVLVIRDWIASLDTNHGTIAIEFYPDSAPRHVLQFLRLSRTGFYDGSIFHRVIPGFMMQGGAPASASKRLKTTLKAEFNERKHVRGTVSMARSSDPDSAGSQFFICFGEAPHLDRNYTVFGKVVEGLEVVRSVERVKSDHHPCAECKKDNSKPGPTSCCGRHHADKPKADVVIKRITLAVRKK